MKKISLKSIGLLSYLLATGKKSFSAEEIYIFEEGRHATRGAIDELKRHGLLSLETIRSDSGVAGKVYILADWLKVRQSDFQLFVLYNINNTITPTERPTVTKSDNQEIEQSEKVGKVSKGSIAILKDPEVVSELAKKFKVSESAVKIELEKMSDWLKSKGKRQKDYVAFARNWFRRNQEKPEATQQKPNAGVKKLTDEEKRIIYGK